MTGLEMDHVRILVVDDDPTFLKVMEGSLSRLGCRMAFAGNGQEAVEKIRQYNFDLCFMDIMMPGMNGVEATQIIREEISRQLPIIAVTSSNMKATKDKCYEVGMNDFIVKPVSPEVVQSSIVRYALRHPV